MIIDFHTHTFPDKVAAAAIPMMEQEIAGNNDYESPMKAKLSGTAAQLEQSGKEYGIDLSVVLPVATSPKQSESINLFAARANEQTRQTGLMSFGAIHPDNENYREILRGLKSRGIKGIKLHPDYQKVMFDDPRYLRIMDFAAELDMIIVTHAGVDIGKPHVVHCTPDMVCRVDEVLQYPKLVLAHMGGWRMWDEVEEKIVGRRLYLDTAVCFEPTVHHMEKEQFLRFINKHGADKILFGTDSPWSDQGAGIKKIKSMELPENQERAILGGNAKALLSIKTGDK